MTRASHHHRSLAVIVSAIVAAALALTLTGCGVMGPRQDADDLFDTADALVATTEADLPSIAVALGATVTKATVMHSIKGTAMGGTEVDVFLDVTTELTGPPVTQADAERILTEMGYSAVAGPPAGANPDLVAATALLPGGKTDIRIVYGVFLPRTENERLIYEVIFSRTKPGNVKYSEFTKYANGAGPAVDVAGINARR